MPEFAICQVQAEYGESTWAAQALVADTLSLVYPLPRVFAVLKAGETSLWRARMVATSTRQLSLEQVTRLDDFLTSTSSGHAWDTLIARISRRRLSHLIEQVLVVEDDEVVDDQIAAALAERDISVRPGIRGIVEVFGTLAVGDGARLNLRLGQVAGWLRETGDTRPLAVLRSVALGMLADPARLQALWLHVRSLREDQPLLPDNATDEPGAADDQQAEDQITTQLDSADQTGQPGDLPMPATVLYVHHDRTTATWTLEGHGPLTRTEAAEIVGHSNVRVQPVIDLAADLTYTAYRAPTRLRDQLALLNAGACTFPHCEPPARSGDYDHIQPHPRGPTSSRNGHMLCRRHHRLKTHHRWTVHQPVAGTWTWTDPHHRHYLVTAGTTTHLT